MSPKWESDSSDLTPLERFVSESNRIEGVDHFTAEEVQAHERILSLDEITISDLVAFVEICTKGYGELRQHNGMDVVVGNHRPPPGGPLVREDLERILREMGRGSYEAFVWHHEYETLHPFRDGNGRSGRALWLWCMGGIEKAPLGFLQTWYYQSLNYGAGRWKRIEPLPQDEMGG